MSATPHTVWVAENDHELRRLVCRALRARGLTVIELVDGGELLARIRRLDGDRGPALLITDHHMPRALGLDAVQALRRTGRDLPVVVMTAWPDPAVEARAREAHVFAMLRKPFDLRVLLQTVARALGESDVRGDPPQGVTQAR